MPVYYDITDVLDYAQNNATLSGVQRTTLNILCHLVNTQGPDHIHAIASHPVFHETRSYSAHFFGGAFDYDQKEFCTYFSLNMNDRFGLREWLGRAGHAVQSRIYRREIAFAAGDVVFIGGATWGLARHLQVLAERRHRDGIRIIHFIHDLIPLLAPEHVDDGLPQKFEAWLDFLAKNVDGFIVNSQATKADLDDWLAARGHRAESRVVRLAHQFGQLERHSLAPAERFAVDPDIGARVRNVSRRPYVLCVGTMESRKNNWALANVWRRLHERLKDRTPRLIFAGNPGWLNEDFTGFLAGTGSLSGTISVIERPTDRELAHLYRSCLFSVFISHKEGWGLPIGEGLWLGRPVLCSNTSAMPEAGGELADYADPSSLDSIEAAALRLITDDTYREARATQIAAAELRSWEDVAGDLWHALSAEHSRNLVAARDGEAGLSAGTAARTVPAKEGA